LLPGPPVAVAPSIFVLFDLRSFDSSLSLSPSATISECSGRQRFF